jgi:hypothetical protein
MSPKRLRRREFLRRIGGAALSALGLAGAAVTTPGCAPSRDPLSEALASFFEDPDRAAAVGVVYLEHFPDEADSQTLLARLFARLFEMGVAGAREQAAADPEALVARLRAQHREDFAVGRTVRLAGWALSLTEARLCAWTALT